MMVLPFPTVYTRWLLVSHNLPIFVAQISLSSHAVSSGHVHVEVLLPPVHPLAEGALDHRVHMVDLLYVLADRLLVLKVLAAQVTEAAPVRQHHKLTCNFKSDPGLLPQHGFHSLTLPAPHKFGRI